MPRLLPSLAWQEACSALLPGWKSLGYELLSLSMFYGFVSKSTRLDFVYLIGCWEVGAMGF